MIWGRKEREELVAEAARSVLGRQDSASLYHLAYAGMRSTRPDAGLSLGDLASIIHLVCRGDSSACAGCPNNLTAAVLGARMREHRGVSGWETDWGIADEVRTHEEIHCRPCPHWGRRKP